MNKLERTKRFLQEYLPLFNSKFSKQMSLEGDPQFALLLSEQLTSIKIRNSIKITELHTESIKSESENLYFIIEIEDKDKDKDKDKDEHKNKDIISGKYFDSAGDTCRENFPKFNRMISIGWNNLYHQLLKGLINSTLSENDIKLLQREMKHFSNNLFNWEFLDSTELSSKNLREGKKEEISQKQLTKHSRGKLKDKPIYSPPTKTKIHKSAKIAVNI